MEVSTVWKYIDKNKSECDILDEGGCVFGHIGHYKSKDTAKKAAGGIRKIWSSINFKLITSPKKLNKNQEEEFDLYGDYWKFFELSEIKKV